MEANISMEVGKAMGVDKAMEAGNSTVDRVTDKLVQFGLLRCGWDSVNSSAFKLLF